MNSADPNDRDHFTYGAGRRACPGIHVAERSLFINVARVLWGFNLNKKKGVEVTTEMMPGFFSVPKAFECDIKPRSERHAELMKRESGRAEKEGLNF